MADTATAQPIAPVDATSTVETPESQQQQPAKKAAPKFETKFDEVMWRVNEPAEDETQDETSMNDIIDRAQKNASKSDKEIKDASQTSKAKEPVEDQAEPVQQNQEKATPQKEKLKVDGEEFELDPDQIRRFAQKGISHEKNNRKTAEAVREVRAREQAVEQREASVNELVTMLKDPKGALEILTNIHGEDIVRDMSEGFLRPRVEREMLPEHERRALVAEERAQRAEQALKQRDEQVKQKQIEQQTDTLVQEYQKTIIEALKLKGLPKTDFTAMEMASWMERGTKKGIDYKPEQLAQFVKEDNILRVGALTEDYVTQITEAKKKGDLDAVVKAGEGLVELLGEPVMFAIAKYHLAKHMRTPAQPKQVLDTPKTKPPEEGSKKKKGGYMSEDEFTAERKRRVALMEKGIDPGEWK